MENVYDLPNKDKTKNENRIYLRFIDARDTSLFPLQVLLFIFALIEAIQAVLYIVDENSMSDQHIYAHLGSYMLAYASALFIISFRPARARGLLIMVTVAAFGFVATSIIDVIRGNADAAGELSHITKLIGPLIVWVIAKRVINFSNIKK